MSDISCGKCKSHWTGAGRCHCGGCHMTFSSLSAFDAHQRHSEKDYSGPLCSDPVTKKLVPYEKTWGVMWGYEKDETQEWAPWKK